MAIGAGEYGTAGAAVLATLLDIDDQVTPHGCPPRCANGHRFDVDCALRTTAERPALAGPDAAVGGVPFSGPITGALIRGHETRAYGLVGRLDAGSTAAELRTAIRHLAFAGVLAAAHDRQPYPTSDAYEAACAALEAQRARADAAEARLRDAPAADTSRHVPTTASPTR